ncbi:MAG: B12-binding domain-containing radical SAM protein [Acidobacteria bacterium]|jgi:radical SAM superfamily enzyme YgiQ (UPF0313 family)|nr:B12-binding domain-containing radical SAM protein [Acidobacteriota bacterium]
MKKPKLLIIVLFQNLGDSSPYFARSPAPPLPGILLAALTPDIVDVEVLHEMVRPVDYTTDADFIALSFMDYCAPHAIEVSKKFRFLGKVVIAGGKYASTFPEMLLPYFDSVYIGEAHILWPEVVKDMVNGNLKKSYEAPLSPPLEHIPPPRYDLVEPGYSVSVVTEATRGCIYKCSFCQLTIKNEDYRKRPIPDVIADLKATEKLPFYKRKIAMIYDNNFGGDMNYAKELLKEIAGLKLWGLGIQFSFDCLNDDQFVDLLSKANCTMAFIGLESLNEPSLEAMHKTQNKVKEYKELFLKLKKRGILTFTGMMLAIDEDTADYYENLPAKLDDIDPSTILLSISIPIPGTPFYKKVVREGRLIDTNLAHYEGDHLVFKPKTVKPEDIFKAYVNINKTFYSLKAISRRWIRLMAAMESKGNIFKNIFKRIFISAIFLKLSIFQKHHAKKRVYPIIHSSRELELETKKGTGKL